jgi:hypothetical protein
MWEVEEEVAVKTAAILIGNLRLAWFVFEQDGLFALRSPSKVTHSGEAGENEHGTCG